MMKDFIKSHMRALLVVAWTLALALAIGIHWLLSDDVIRQGVENVIAVFVTLLTCGIRLFPCFRQGIFGSCKNKPSSNNPPEDNQMIKPAETTLSVVEDTTKNKDEEEDCAADNLETGETKQDEADKEAAEKVQENNNNNSNSKPKTKRLYFIDNVRVFLMVIVVAHHITGHFIGHAPYGIGIGYYDNLFSNILINFLVLNQAYFMPLFFFISAYFFPKSYDRKGKDVFLVDKAKRLFIPAIVVTFGIMPLQSLIGQAGAGFSSFSYSMADTPGPSWFLYWLLFFCFVYHSFKVVSSKKHSDDDIGQREPTGFPGLWKRWIAGAVVCGLLMWAFSLAVGGQERGNFYTMPVGIQGSFTCNVLFFGVGTIAARNGWLSSPILSSWWSQILLLIAALIEYFLGQYLFTGGIFTDLEILPLSWIFFGMYCVDMSTFILSFFQTHFNTKPGKFGQFLADSGYTVYLIHPVVTTGFTSAFIKVYNLIYGDVIQFEEGSTTSSSQLLGPGDGSLSLFVGWLIVLVLSELVVWPLAYAIRSLPGFNQIL